MRAPLGIVPVNAGIDWRSLQQPLANSQIVKGTQYNSVPEPGRRYGGEAHVQEGVLQDRMACETQRFLASDKPPRCLSSERYRKIAR